MKQIVDKSAIIVPTGTVEDYKRPDHPDFMTALELKAISFSGQRTDTLTGNYELWILGDKVKVITDYDIGLDPQAINKAVAEYFALDDVQPDIADLKRFRGVTK